MKTIVNNVCIGNLLPGRIGKPRAHVHGGGFNLRVLLIWQAISEGKRRFYSIILHHIEYSALVKIGHNRDVVVASSKTLLIPIPPP